MRTKLNSSGWETLAQSEATHCLPSPQGRAERMVGNPHGQSHRREEVSYGSDGDGQWGMGTPVIGHQEGVQGTSFLQLRGDLGYL